MILKRSRHRFVAFTYTNKGFLVCMRNSKYNRESFVSTVQGVVLGRIFLNEYSSKTLDKLLLLVYIVPLHLEP